MSDFGITFLALILKWYFFSFLYNLTYISSTSGGGYNRVVIIIRQLPGKYMVDHYIHIHSPYL